MSNQRLRSISTSKYRRLPAITLLILCIIPAIVGFIAPDFLLNQVRNLPNFNLLFTFMVSLTLLVGLAVFKCTAIINGKQYSRLKFLKPLSRNKFLQRMEQICRGQQALSLLRVNIGNAEELMDVISKNISRTLLATDFMCRAQDGLLYVLFPSTSEADVEKLVQYYQGRLQRQCGMHNIQSMCNFEVAYAQDARSLEKQIRSAFEFEHSAPLPS